MKFREHTIVLSYNKYYFIQNHRIENIYKIKYSNNIYYSRKKRRLFWTSGMRRQWSGYGLQPISDRGIKISIPRAFFWCVGYINKLWMGWWQLTFIWARPKIKAKKRPWFSSARFQAKILFYKNVSKVAQLHQIQTLMWQMRYLSHICPL